MPKLPSIPARGHRVVKKLFALMRDQGVTVRELCDAAGVPRTTLYEWRTRRGSPTLFLIDACFEALGYHLDVTLPDKRTKNFIVTKPNGNEIRVRNLNKFCRDNALNASEMYRVANPEHARLSHKGWTVRRD